METTIVVCQMGKVASNALVRGILDQGAECHHTHVLGNERICKLVELATRPDRGPRFLEEMARQVTKSLIATQKLEQARANPDRYRVKLVTLTRHPLTWYESAFLQNIKGLREEILPLCMEAAGTKDEAAAWLHLLEQVLALVPRVKWGSSEQLVSQETGEPLQAAPHVIRELRTLRRPLYWFQVGLNRVLDRDLLQDVAEMGGTPATVEGDYFDLLLLRYENLSEDVSTLRNYLDLPNLAIPRMNTGKKKADYDIIHAIFQDLYARHQDALEQIYATPYCRTFSYGPLAAAVD